MLLVGAFGGLFEVEKGGITGEGVRANTRPRRASSRCCYPVQLQVLGAARGRGGVPMHIVQSRQRNAERRDAPLPLL